MSRVKPFVLAGFCLVCGCFDSKNPLSPPDAAKVDKRLVGIWRQTCKDGEVVFHIGLAGGPYPAGMLRIVEVDYAGKTLSAPMQYLAFTTTLDHKTYLNVVDGGDQDKIAALDKSGWKASAVEGYSIMKYELDGDEAKLWMMNSDVAETAINAGKVKGKTVDGMLTIADSTENVAKFVAASGNGLFLSLGEDGNTNFRRVKLAAKR